MKNPALLLIVACAALAAPARAAFTPQATALPGSVPQGFNYQGRLEDNGFPVTATKPMVFRVYDALSGGNLLWTSPSQGVSVTLGLFNATVPVPVTTLVGGGARYLEVQIAGTTMSPRELLSSVPYALIAKSVEGTIDVSTAGLTINSGPAATQPSLTISSETGNVGIGTANLLANAKLTVAGDAYFTGAAQTRINLGTTQPGAKTWSITNEGNANRLRLLSADDASDTNPVYRMVIEGATGNVGIGTANPAARLEISTDVSAAPGFEALRITNTGAFDGNYISFPRAADPTHGIIFSHAATAIDKKSWVRASGGVSQHIELQAGSDDSAVRGIVALQVTDGDVGIGGYSPQGKLEVRPDAASAYSLFVSSQNSAGTLVVDNQGNVGIGTTGPQAKLSVYDSNANTTFASKGFVEIFNTDATPGNTFGLAFRQSDSGAGLNTVANIDAVGVSHAPGAQSGALAFGTRNVGAYGERMRIDPAGNIGIGTNNPTLGKLQVDGTAAAVTLAVKTTNIAANSATLRLQNSAGAFNDVMEMSHGGGQTNFRDGNGLNIMTLDVTSARLGVGTNAAVPNDRLEVAGGNVRLTAVAGTPGSVKLFSALTVGAVACAAQCGANTACLATWDSAGVASTCATAAAGNRCLCSGFGD